MYNRDNYNIGRYMSIKTEYRPNVAMIIVSHHYPEKKEIFIAQRNDLLDIWQFPQGGIDERF